ncbi:hypothetical protein BLNAU_17959 [Blattamonas nauphoetae]|uniref:Uncharacterized protein n=1 Tax=Blattamonas nauphoetae TaxID=2049346 RepID=A0ABQ9X5W8_9EUKA|nr:hypothetical protein BLNAU_17959 [Blattamonas nauphoetae]
MPLHQQKRRRDDQVQSTRSKHNTITDEGRGVWMKSGHSNVLRIVFWLHSGEEWGKVVVTTSVTHATVLLHSPTSFLPRAASERTPSSDEESGRQRRSEQPFLAFPGFLCVSDGKAVFGQVQTTALMEPERVPRKVQESSVVQHCQPGQWSGVGMSQAPSTTKPGHQHTRECRE